MNKLPVIVIGATLTLGAFANITKPKAELEVTVSGYRKGNPEYTKRVTITPDNIAQLNEQLETGTTVGYMMELTSGKACYRGDAETVMNKILKNRDVIEYFGDEECSNSGHLSADGRMIVFRCVSESVDKPYKVKISPCKKKVRL